MPTSLLLAFCGINMHAMQMEAWSKTEREKKREKERKRVIVPLIASITALMNIKCVKKVLCS